MTQRQIVLIDPENLAGTGNLAETDPVPVAQGVFDLARIGIDDIVVVGGDKRNAFELDVIAKRLGGRVVWGMGKDGAEKALERAFVGVPETAWDYSDAPITRVVICSGDRYFVPIARAAKAIGRRVLTISRRPCLSLELAQTSDQCLVFA